MSADHLAERPRLPTHRGLPPTADDLPAPFVEQFQRYWPYMRNAGHQKVALRDDAPPVQSQEDFEALSRRLDGTQVEAFARRLTRYREQVRRVRQAQWLAAHQLFPGITSCFSHCTRPLYVVTARDQASVYEVLGAAGLFIPRERIYGEQRAKVQACDAILQLEQVRHSDLLLVDDHLRNVLSARFARLSGCLGALEQNARHRRIVLLHSIEEMHDLFHP